MKGSDLEAKDKCQYYYSSKCFYGCINNNKYNLICKYSSEENSIKYLIDSIIKNLCIYCYNGNHYYPI